MSSITPRTNRSAEQPRVSSPSGAINALTSAGSRPNSPSVNSGGKFRTRGPGQSRRASRRPTSGILGTQSVDSSSPLTKSVSGSDGEAGPSLRNRSRPVRCKALVASEYPSSVARPITPPWARHATAW